jgi:hypothetical protein
VNTGKDGIRDSMQRRNLKDEECFDREIWKTSFGVEENCVFTEKLLHIYNIGFEISEPYISYKINVYNFL